MANEHGIYVTESPTSLPLPTLTQNGVPVYFGTAPVNMAATPALNKPVLCESYEDAVKSFGYSDDFDSYGLCEAIYTHFIKTGVGPIVLVNVLDPETHSKTLAAASYPVSAKQAVIEQEGVLKENLSVKVGSTALAEGTDYTASYNANGYLVLTMITGGAGASASSVTVTGKQLDPSAVTESTVIGGYDSTTKKRSGIECVSDVYAMTGRVPGLLAAPGWSHKPNVGRILQLKAPSINEIFPAQAVLDIDTATCLSYENVKAKKDAAGYNGNRTFACWPMAKTADHDAPIYYSAILIAALQRCDADHESVPSRSPSNLPLSYVTGAVLANGTDVVLERTEANVVEAAGVVTMLRWGSSFRTWGNYTAAAPEGTDPKDRWILCRRMFDWQASNFVLLYIDQVDENISYRLIEGVVDNENKRLGAYIPVHMAAARIEFRASDNSDEQILSGKIHFKQYLSPYIPAKVIFEDLEYDVESLMAAILGGGEAE